MNSSSNAEILAIIQIPYINISDGIAISISGNTNRINPVILFA